MTPFVDELAAVYARYSTDRQSPLSIPHQLRDVREALPRLGLLEMGCFSDPAHSGFMLRRPGLQAALKTIQSGQAKVLIAESYSRISRDKEHGSRILKQVTNWGGKIFTLREGHINTMIVGMVCTTSQMTKDNDRAQTRRGLRGVVEEGRVPSRPPYGYRKTADIGVLEINPATAPVVVRIFEQYAGGLGARAIAQGLNDAGIPGPSGGFWKANTIVGDRQVMTGIINNMLYIGVIVWNRQTWHVDVDTEKRRSTPLPREEWIYHDAPHLRIVTDDLRARVRARQGEFVARGPVRRRTRPLAGLLLCGLCGSPMSVLGRDRYGCPTHKELGDEHCSNPRTAAAADIEAHALEVLRDSLLAPYLVSLFQRTFTRELKALRSSEVDADAATRKELASAEAELRQLVDALGKVPAVARDAVLAQMETVGDRIATLRSELPEPASSDNVVDFVPPVDLLERELERLWQKLMLDPETGASTRDALAVLLGTIRLIPGKKRGGYSFELVRPEG